MNRRDYERRLPRSRRQVTDRAGWLVRSAGERPLRIGVGQPSSPQREVPRLAASCARYPGMSEVI